jgi:hypothetical protein
MSHRAEAGPSQAVHGYSWRNNRRVRDSHFPRPLVSNLHEKKEILYPCPGTIIIGRDDLVVPPSENIVRLHPHGTVKLIVPLNAQWEQMFHDIKNRKLYGGIHLRSNMAQAQFDITDWSFIKGKEGVIEVTLTNFSSSEAEIEAGKQLKLGNPYCYESPLEGDALRDFASQIEFAQDSPGQEQHVITTDEISRREFIGDDSLLPSHEMIEIKLPRAHPNIVLYKKTSVINLRSGPDRHALHEQIAIDESGVLIQELDSLISQHEPDIQLASTDAFSMPPRKALVLLACVKEVGGRQYLVHHSASAVHRSEALVQGTSKYLQGETYKHKVITESYNYIFPRVYPSSVLCGAFNMEII